MPVDTFVLFGATGDLARKKLLPALFGLDRQVLPRQVVGVALEDWNEERFHEMVRDAVTAANRRVTEQEMSSFVSRFRFVSGSYLDRGTFDELAKLVGDEDLLHYLAVPPNGVAVIADHLKVTDLLERARVVVEKPFGRDLATARHLNRVLHAVTTEDRIFRIDHYLGKESVENLMAFRFGNSMLEPIWNREHVASVQITMAESIGVNGRGRFYDNVGAIRDVVQNHALQIVALLAMDPPVGHDADAWRAETVRVLRAMQPVQAADLVRGQYVGYRTEAGVDPASQTETYAAMKLTIDSWRWAGVPFYVRAGKALHEDALEAVVEFKRPPQQYFANGEGTRPPSPNIIRFCLGAEAGVDLRLHAKRPGPTMSTRAIDLRVDFTTTLGQAQTAYERLLHDSILGDVRRFARQDAVEEQWRVMEPALRDPSPLHHYAPGSWGPLAALGVVGHDEWYRPNV